MSVLPAFLSKQALMPSARARVETPTIVRYRPINQQDVIEWEVSHASVASLLMYSSCAHYFGRQRIRKHSAEWFEYQPTLVAPAHTYSRWISTVTPEGIAANKARAEEALRELQDSQSYKRMFAESIKDSRRYHVKALDQHMLVSCPVTGIVHEVSFPSIPVFFEQNHPLANLKNVQATLDWFFATSENPNRLEELDMPILAGMLIVMLRAKHILQEQETSAIAENALLQTVTKSLMCEYLKCLHESWEQNKVWQAMPHIRLLAQGMGPAIMLAAWFKKANLHLLGKPVYDPNVQAKLFEATRTKSAAQRTLKVYSAETGQHRKLKENKESANALFANLKEHMSPVLRTLVRTTIADLILITQENKETVTAAIAKTFVGTKQETQAKQLISIIQTTETNHIALELGRASDEMNIPRRSIKEILAAKSSNTKGN